MRDYTERTLAAPQIGAPVLRSGVRYSKPQIIAAIRTHADRLLQDGRLHMTKDFIQHADMSVFQHCAHVAYVSCVLALTFGIRVSWDELIRGALIKRHMWPVTIIPPTCREAWLVTTADKICTILEVFRSERVRL